MVFAHYRFRVVILDLTYGRQTCTTELKLSSAKLKQTEEEFWGFNPGSSFIRSCFLYELQIITVDKSVSFLHPAFKKQLKICFDLFC